MKIFAKFFHAAPQSFNLTRWKTMNTNKHNENYQLDCVYYLLLLTISHILEPGLPIGLTRATLQTVIETVDLESLNMFDK